MEDFDLETIENVQVIYIILIYKPSLNQHASCTITIALMSH